ncbi:MAG: hypothetical protein A2511_08535 [Deltaproteobacteria bacterium RIFOXYD12_FULL_50_9]|nr:MAG: hypothetical protein A2511_08535 [Deltaproteobacteria bacterium RIFOXYD12_FULL_50_9]
MPSKHSLFIVYAAVILAACIVLCDDCVAFSFPFRTFGEGDLVPAAEFVEYNNKQVQSFAGLKGKYVLAVFWGADIQEKREHSILLLKQLNTLESFFKDRNITLLSVNIQGDVAETIADVLKQSGSSGKVYIDPSQQAYASLGIYVMPALLFIDKSGKAAAGFGYSRNSVAHLKGEIEILLGEKTKAQVEEDLNPKVVEKSGDEKQAIHHLNFAFVLLKRGMTDQAIREFEKAIELEPNSAQAAAEVGCLYLETGDLAKAEVSLAKGLALAPDSLRAKMCSAQLEARRGNMVRALASLEKLLIENPNTPRIRYLIGRLLQEQGQSPKALKYYREAYETLNKQIAE